MLTYDIILEEVERVVNRLTKNEVYGFDWIHNECLKNNDVQIMLYNLFELYFEYGKIPSLSHIPKSSNKDPHVPLSYHAINLLSCVGKAYSHFFNRHIVSYCKQMDVFNDEQNGFRQDKLCADYIFSLTSADHIFSLTSNENSSWEPLLKGIPQGS